MAWLETLFGDSGEYALQVLRIIGIDILLAGDNAVVIALACRTLPEASAWPASFSALARR